MSQSTNAAPLLGVNPVIVGKVRTSWLSGGAEVEAVQVESPPYEAVMLCTPIVKALITSVAVPLLTLPVPRDAAPSLNVTGPVHIIGVIVAVKVAGLPTPEGFGFDVRDIDELANTNVNVGDVAWARH
ncbi:MAG TPA: hypothetical protein VN577_11385 [Terriglobales bacterium]|nr:hypothetical protein [Terriglobales bacterium]